MMRALIELTILIAIVLFITCGIFGYAGLCITISLIPVLAVLAAESREKEFF